MATLGTEESGHCGEVAVVERLKQEWMYGLSAQKKWPLSRGGPLVDWFDCTWITIKFGPFLSFFENGSVFSLQKMTEAKRHCSAAINLFLIQSFNFTTLATYFVPCEQWLLLAGCYPTKGEKPLHATICFSIKQACPRDAYIKMSNDITFSSFARNISKTTTLQMHHTFLYTSLLFLHDYHIKMPYFKENVNQQQQTFFLFLSLDMFPRNSNPVWFAYIWQSEREE